MVENVVKLAGKLEVPRKTYLTNQHSTNCCNQVMPHCLLDPDPTYTAPYNFTRNITLPLH